MRLRNEVSLGYLQHASVSLQLAHAVTQLISYPLSEHQARMVTHAGHTMLLALLAVLQLKGMQT